MNIVQRPCLWPEVAPRKDYGRCVCKDPIRAIIAALGVLAESDHIGLTHGSAIIVPARHVPVELVEATRLSRQIIDHRYYRVANNTLGEDFAQYYIILRDTHDDLRGVHPIFLVRQNLLAGTSGRLAAFAQRVRKYYPHFLTLRTLMAGNPAGPGALGLRLHDASPDDAAWTARALTEALAAYGKRQRSSLVVLKDFPTADRMLLKDLTHANHQFARLASMPMTALALHGYKSFDDYMQKALSKVTRKGLRRKFREAAELPLEMTVVQDIAHCVDEVFALYQQVYDRAKLRFEKLNREFLRQLGRTMPDRARFFLWRTRAGAGCGRLVAACVTLVNTHDSSMERALYDLYLGMDYPLALEKHLYFVTMRDMIEWSIQHGIETYYSTPLNYESKLHFRHRLVPQDLYVRHLSPLLNPLFKWAMHFAGPTRHDRILPKFPNAADLEGPE